MANGLTKKQLDSLYELFNGFLAPSAPQELSAPPPAPLSALPPEPPHQQSISAPVLGPISTRSSPPLPSVESIEEVEQKQVYKPLRKIGQKRRRSLELQRRRVQAGYHPLRFASDGLPT